MRGRNLGDKSGSIGKLGICLVLRAKKMSSLLGGALQNSLAVENFTPRRDKRLTEKYYGYRDEDHENMVVADESY